MLLHNLKIKSLFSYSCKVLFIVSTKIKAKTPSKEIEKIVEESLMSKKIVLINVGPNNVHEILDEVRSDH